MDYYIGQIFDNMYPPEASVWCNANDAMLTEITAGELGRRFRIDAIPEKPIEELREFKLCEIDDAFDSEINDTAHVTSSIDSFEIDARRRDGQNIEGLITYYTEPIPYKGYSETRPNTTLEELQTFKREIFENGVRLYNKKWSLEEAIAEAQTKEELDEIVW